VRGRMDWHSPDFYINCWCVAGLERAAWAAQRVGEVRDAERWDEERRELEAAIIERLLPSFGNPRDAIVTPYPTRALTGARDALTGRFRSWFASTRLDEGGRRRREALWTYFEAAQIHNALLLGLKDEAWKCLDGMLGDGLEPSRDVSAWVEGVPLGNERLPFRNDVGSRGWLGGERAIAGAMPHNWTGAEMVNLIRTVFVAEEDDGLVLGRGVPESWLAPGMRFGVKAMPTDLGEVSYDVTVEANGPPRLEYRGPSPYRVAWRQE